MQCLCFSKPIKWLVFKFHATLRLLSQSLTKIRQLNRLLEGFIFDRSDLTRHIFLKSRQ